MIDWTAPGLFLTGRPRLLNANDTVYCSGFLAVTDGTGEGNLSYTVLKRKGQVAVNMANGVPTAVSCTADDMPLDRCARIEIDRQAELDRVVMAPPPTFINDTTFATVVLAVPEPTFGPGLSLWLAYQTGNGPPTPFRGTLHYANPFAGYGTAIHAAMVRRRDLLASGATQVLPISAGTFHYYPPTDACGTVAPRGEIAIPTPPAIGGLRLVQDTQLQLSKTRPIELSWDNATAGPVDYYIVALSRVVANGDATGLAEVKAWITTDTALEMERTLLEGQHRYIISITAQYSAPNAAMGDFATTRWPDPIAHAINWSSVFTVAP
jgi:hypothetical protein